MFSSPLLLIPSVCSPFFVFPLLYFLTIPLCLFVFYLAGCLTNCSLSLLFSFTHHFPFFCLSGPLCWVVWRWSRSGCCRWFLTCCEAPRMLSSVLSRVCWGTSPDTAKTKLIWVSESFCPSSLSLITFYCVKHPSQDFNILAKKMSRSVKSYCASW